MSNADRRPWKARIIVLGFISVHILLLSCAASSDSPTVDEVAYLPAGLSHWVFGRFEVSNVNPPLVRLVAALPLLGLDVRTNWREYFEGSGAVQSHALGQDFLVANGNRSFWLFTIARWACIPFSIVGASCCYLWARDLYGHHAGYAALLLWCFCPNVLGHGHLITADVPAAAFGVSASYMFWLWLRRPSWTLCILAGVIVGLAQLTKITWIILFAILPLYWVCATLSSVFSAFLGRRRPSTDVVVSQSSRPSIRALANQCAQLVAIVGIALYVLNCGYAFDGSFSRLNAFSFRSTMLSYLACQGEQATQPPLMPALRQFPVPLPRQYVIGLDMQKALVERPTRSYFRGAWATGGRWYYYLYGLLVKLPVGTLLLLAAAVLATAFGRRAVRRSAHETFLLWPAITLLILISSQTAHNRHVRYALPVLPFAYIFASQVVAIAIAHGSRLAVGLSLASLALSVMGSLAVFPHSLSYFNSIAGGPTRGHWHLDNSNIDWGQDLLHLRDWLRKHREITSIHLLYFGSVDPQLAGIAYTLPPSVAMQNADSFDARALIAPGWYAISANFLVGRTGVMVFDGKGGRSVIATPLGTPFRELSPVARAGYSIYIYHVTMSDIERLGTHSADANMRRLATVQH